VRFAIVVDGQCRGFVLRSRHQYSAFDADEKPLGLYDTEQGAISAIFPQTTNLTTENLSD